MEDYMDPDEEYELQYQEELELIQQYEDNYGAPSDCPLTKTRQCINFDEPNKTQKNGAVSAVSQDVCEAVASKSIAIVAASKRFASELTPNLKSRPPAKKSKPNNFSVLASDSDLGVSLLDPPTLDLPGKLSTNATSLYGVTSLTFPTWNFLTLNTDFGERLFVRLRNASPISENFEFCDKTQKVSDSFRRMKDNVLRRLDDEKTNKKEPREMEVTEIETSELWVEQFKPKRYLELLSDEGVNRALLTWVKSWDKIVFKRERKEKKVEPKDTGKPPPFKGKIQLQEEKASEIDEDGRPHYKVALLCGAPGIGKTTLSHVIATLAGYNVIEVNASDDRNVETFRTKLEAATEMQSVMGDRKPNCLILDEIDGAPIASIDFLIKFISGKVTEKVKKGKKEKTVKQMNRPVICICNEPYTPALRQLRQQAFVLYFPHTSSTKLATRLMDICRVQGMKTDLTTLALLCDKAQSDIRSCITTLHFFKNQKRTVFKSNDVKNASVGQKDIQKSLFNVWQEIFQKPSKKTMPGGGTAATDDYCSYHPDNMKRLENIVRVLQSSGDYEKLQQGVYENVLKMQFPWFQRSLATGLEWFCFSDLLDTSIRHSQHFILMPYLPYCFASWHFLFSTSAWPKITYPTVGFENHLKETKYRQIVTDVLRGLKPGVRAFTQSRSLLLDVLPMLPHILAPPLRPVNSSLFSAQEKADFRNLIDILLDFNMNYVQQRAPDGAYFFSLDPGFQEVVQFGESSISKVAELSYNIKHTVAREVEMERLRRNDNSSTLNPPAKSAATTLPSSAPVVPSHQMKLKPKPLPTEPIQYKDFFGRIVQIERPKADHYGLDKNNFLKSRVWFNYKEGFNNAVKKDMTIADLL